ncbi:MAG: class I SAM-dependent DNA methyltransferase [Acidobacteriota bacterium]
MTNLSWNEISDRATEFASKWQGETYEKGESQSFWSDFLAVFGINRRRHGAFFEYAIKKGSGTQGFIDMFWPGKLLAEQKSAGKDLSKANIQAYEYLEAMPDHDLPEAIVVSDFANFHFIHLDTGEKVEFTLADFPKHVKLFGFLLGQASKNIAEQDPVNRKAAESMARLHNQLRDDKYTGHDLEVLLVRLVFCMFADDAGIFDQHTLADYIKQRTSSDGSDLGSRLIQIFQILNTPYDERQNSLDEAIASLPYVNGGLFADPINTPSFTGAMRAEILSAMELDWSKVSPAIFGSMFQGIMDETQRRNLGAHYTSEVNILRVIKPLFLDDLYKEYAAALRSGPRKKFDELRKLQDKLAALKFLDPACGSGNFLVITYRELRKLEHKIVASLAKNSDQIDMLASAGHGSGTLRVNVNQMYGIEIEEFPSLVAQVALWLTDHQMNMEYSAESGKTFKRIPLTASPSIVNANALTTDWADVIAPSELSYILGNPPFNGSRTMSKEQKHDLLAVVGDIKEAGFLDFVTGWYFKAAEFMSQNPAIKTALVSTNSITQGEQASILWKPLFERGVHIDFAHQTFKWSNDAKGNAAVYCVIIGFGLLPTRKRRIFEYANIKGEPNEITTQNINAYLVDAPSVFVGTQQKPLCDVPEMNFGNMPADGGNLILSQAERDEIIAKYPQAEQFIKELIGAKELIQGGNRYCLWLTGTSPSELRAIPPILERIEKNREVRAASSRPQLADIPTLFAQITADPTKYDQAIVVPAHSSENRKYLPIAVFGNDKVVHNSCLAIPAATLYHFAILTSRMHMAWMRAVAGRLKSDYRYSKDIVYNSFIWPEVTKTQRAEIKTLAQNILDARAQFPDSSLADLYDPLTMPPTLAKAHIALDRAIDKLYSKTPFISDTERGALLFEKYQQKVNPQASEVEKGVV